MTTDTAIAEPEEASVVDLIDAIEEIVTTGRRVPFSANVVVNEDDALELIDRARLGLPAEVVQARHTIGEREQILAAAEKEAQILLSRAQEDAQALIAEAESRVKQMVGDHEILAVAQERADAMVIEAEERSESVRNEADAYARDVMVELDRQLTRALSTVRKGLETLPKPGKSERRNKR